MVTIMSLAKKHNLKVVEDACHGPLSEYKGKKLGTIGDVGCFSFFSNKNISTGEGGMLVTNNQEYFDRTKLLRSHGMTTMSYERAKGHSTSYDVIELGYNYRIDDLRAAIGLTQLNKIEDDLKKRAQIRQTYLDNLCLVDDIALPFRDYKEFTSNYIFPIVLKDSTTDKRDSVREYLASQGIQTSVHYPAVHRFSIYEPFYVNLPVTDYFANNTITLPMYSKLAHQDVLHIVDTLKMAIK